MSVVTWEQGLSSARPSAIPYDLNNSGGHIIPIFQLKKLSLREVKYIAKVTPNVKDHSGI